MFGKNTFRYALAVLFAGFALISGIQISTTLSAPTYWTDYRTALTKGVGTEDDPYLISNPEELAAFSNAINSFSSSSYHTAHYKLTESINLQGHNWVPIGSTNSFSGVFDGGNFIIQNMKIEPTSSNVGFFGYTNDATIKNLKVEGLISSSSTIESVGGIIGYSLATEISRVSSAVVIETPNANYVGGVIGLAKSSSYANTTDIEVANNLCMITGGNYVGGIVGWINGNISNTFNLAKIKGNTAIAGIAGKLIYKDRSHFIYNSYNVGDIEAISDAAGILGSLGFDEYGSDIYSSKSGVFESESYWFTFINAGVSNCYNTGNITSNGSAGGIAGSINGKGTEANGYNIDQIYNSYNTGKVSGKNAVGGIVGSMVFGSVENVSNSGNINGNSNVGGICGWVYWTSEFKSVLNNGKVTGIGNYVGGIVGGNIGHGEISATSVINSANTGSVSGASYIGGIFGHGCSIIGSYNIGSITGTGDYVGGLEGASEVGESFQIVDSYNKGSVSGKDNRGGLVGYLEESYSSYTIKNCYNTGVVENNGYTSFVASLVGRNFHDNAEITNCYYLENTCNPNKALGTKNGSGVDYSKTYKKTSTELKDSAIVSLISASMSAKINSYPVLSSARSNSISVTLPSATWEIRLNINNGQPIFVDFYW